jgi:hypothetical protein
MQEARGSSPLSSTFPQVNGLLRSWKMALSACNPSKLPEPEFLDWPEPMQVSSMLDDWCTAVSLPSLSDSQTNCQWMIQTPLG